MNTPRLAPLLAALALGAFGCGSDSPGGAGGAGGGAGSGTGGSGGGTGGTGGSGTGGAGGSVPIVTLASGLELPRWMAIDAANLYVANAGDRKTGTIIKVPKAGGTIVVLAQGLDNPERLVVDDQNAYWIAGYDVMRIRKDGSQPMPTVMWNSVNMGLGGLAVDGSSLYVAISAMSIGKMSKVAGGTPSPIVQNTATRFVFDNVRLVVDSRNVYWTHGGSSTTVWMAPLTGGGTPTMLDQGILPGGNKTLRVDGSDVYWLVGQALKRLTPGGTPAVFVMHPDDHLSSFALDATSVYYAEDAPPVDIFKRARSGGTPTRLTGSQVYVWDMEVDETSLYWIHDPGSLSGGPKKSGEIRKRAK